MQRTTSHCGFIDGISLYDDDDECMILSRERATLDGRVVVCQVSRSIGATLRSDYLQFEVILQIPRTWWAK